MQLYFAPLACSLSTRVVIYEAGVAATFTRVDTASGRTEDGEDFRDINPLGLVPTLRTDSGELLTENAAILQYVAELAPASGLMPRLPLEAARVRQWLSFVGTELHAIVFHGALQSAIPKDAKAFALGHVPSRFERLEAQLADRDHLAGRFSVADAYLATVLNWTLVVPEIELERWPALHAYWRRVHARPAYAKAFAEERALYLEERARVETP